MGTANEGFDAQAYVMDSASKFSSVSDLSTSGTVVGGANSLTITFPTEELDATDFTDDAFARIKGLQDGEVSIEGNFDAGDAGQDILLDDKFDNLTDDLQVGVDPDESTGAIAFEITGFITDFEINSTPDGKVEFSATVMMSDGNGVGRLT